MSASRGLRVSALYDDDDIAMRLGIEEAVYGSSLWPGCHSASSLNGFMHLYLIFTQLLPQPDLHTDASLAAASGIIPNTTNSKEYEH